jgi:hypothetical protein
VPKANWNHFEQFDALVNQIKSDQNMWEDFNSQHTNFTVPKSSKQNATRIMIPKHRRVIVKAKDIEKFKKNKKKKSKNKRGVIGFLRTILK